jgi:hypothetical protein
LENGDEKLFVTFPLSVPMTKAAMQRIAAKFASARVAHDENGYFARQLLLEDPSLVWSGLEQAVEAQLQKTYGRPIAEKVAAEFLRRISAEKP